MEHTVSDPLEVRPLQPPPTRLVVEYERSADGIVRTVIRQVPAGGRPIR